MPSPILISSVSYTHEGLTLLVTEPIIGHVS